MPETNAREEAASMEIAVPQTAALPALTWDERKARARMRARTARANQNALDYMAANADADNGSCRIWAIGAMVTEMSGSKFDFAEKATVLLVSGRNETDESSAIDLYGAAGVTAVRTLVAELGEGPWPEALPFALETVETTRGDRPVIVPMF